MLKVEERLKRLNIEKSFIVAVIMQKSFVLPFQVFFAKD